MLYVGMVAPHAIKVDVRKQASDTWNPLNVTSATIEVLKPDGGTDTWVAALGTPTANGITITKILSTGDLDIAGVYRVYAKLTMSVGGTLRTSTFGLTVASEFDLAGSQC